MTRLLTRQPNVVAVRSVYSSGEHSLVSLDRRQTYVTATFRAVSDKTIQDESKRITSPLARYRWVRLGGIGPANAQVSHDLGHAELLAFPFIFLLSPLFFRSLVASALPPLLGGLAIVFTATLLIRFLMTGTVILPVKAGLMNALNLSAVFGILVLIFQDGHLQSLLGFTEAHDAGVPSSEAVAVGLERTGRIVTAAALLFAVAIGAFVTSKVVFIKELGLGAAVTVLIDASVIRAARP